MESLTGFDEIAISKWFDDIGVLTDKGGSMLGRALVFVMHRRDGLTDADAHTAAMELSLAGLNSAFAEESEESGKDEPQSEQPPIVSLTSV